MTAEKLNELIDKIIDNAGALDTAGSEIDDLNIEISAARHLIVRSFELSNAVSLAIICNGCVHALFHKCCDNFCGCRIAVDDEVDHKTATCKRRKEKVRKAKVVESDDEGEEVKPE